MYEFSLFRAGGGGDMDIRNEFTPANNKIYMPTWMHAEAKNVFDSNML